MKLFMLPACAVFAAALLGGCLSAEKTTGVAAPSAAPAEASAEPTDADLLAQARVFLDKQENKEAAKLYLRVKDSARDRDLRFDAVFGAALALQRLGKLPAAIGVLMPAPLAATTPREARHLALLGELYLRSRALGTAAHWLRTALACPKLPQATWVAVARFNLGKCLISLDAQAEAIASFRLAGRDFKNLGNITAAELCESAVRQLLSIDRLSAPQRCLGPGIAPAPAAPAPAPAPAPHP